MLTFFGIDLGPIGRMGSFPLWVESSGVVGLRGTNYKPSASCFSPLTEIIRGSYGLQ